MNTSNITGRISRLDYYDTKEGDKFCKFTVASKRRNDVTDFIPCVAFGYIVDTIEKYGFVGQLVGVTGELHSGSYEKDGSTIYTLDLKVDKFDILQWDRNNDEG